MTISIDTFKQAHSILKPILKETNLIKSDFLSLEHNAEILIKPENLQRTGAFKIRGAFNKISTLSKEEQKCGIVTASAGNHAQGVALGAKIFSERSNQKIVATIVMPETTPLIKVEATEALGAQVVLWGDTYDDAYNKAEEIANKSGAVFVHPFNDIDVIIGQGSIGLEILEEANDIDILIVPVGGGGLIAGISSAVKTINPNIQVIGVEPEGAAGITTSMMEGTLIELPNVNTIADGVAVKLSGELCFDIIKNNVDKMVTVSDTEIMEALLILIEREKIIAENAGALSIAALNHIDIEGKKVVSLISGGNIDVMTISEMINRGLVSRGRLFSFGVELHHKPGELVKISNILAREKANVVQLSHDQFHNPTRFKSVRLDVTVETNGMKHVSKITQALTQAGYEILLN